MEQARFECPNCGKVYRWQSKIAGKKVRCSCTQKFRVPMVPGEDAQPDGPLVGRGKPTETPPESPSENTQEVADAGAGAALAAALEPPAEPGPESNPYELDLPADDPAADTAPMSARSPSARIPAGAGATKCPACNSPLRAGAVICLNCGYNLAEGAKVQTVVEADAGDAAPPEKVKGRFKRKDKSAVAADAASPPAVPDAPGADRVMARARLQQDLADDMARKHHFQEKVLPLIFLGVGAVLLLINAFVLVPMLGDLYAIPFSVNVSIGALIGYTILFLIQLPCLFVGILIVSKLFGSAFGELFTAIKKLAALALLAGQFDVMVDLGFDIMLEGLGFLAFWVKMALSFGVFWALSKQLFDELEPGETLVLWIAMLFLPGFALIAVFALILMYFG